MCIAARNKTLPLFYIIRLDGLQMNHHPCESCFNDSNVYINKQETRFDSKVGLNVFNQHAHTLDEVNSVSEKNGSDCHLLCCLGCNNCWMFNDTIVYSDT